MIDVIICTKNNKDIIADCLNSVLKQDFKKWKGFVVDDGSTDETLELIKENFPEFKIIKANKGPAENRNTAIRRTRSKYVVTMDSDVILTKNCFSEMVRFMEKNPNCAVCGGKLLLNKNKICAAGGMVTRIAGAFDFAYGKSSKKYNKVRAAPYICSAAMIIRRKILDRIGLFDKRFFYNFEDTDLSWRCNLAGYDIMYNPAIIAYHKRHITVDKFTMSRKTFLYEKNRMLFYSKNYETKTLVKYFIPFFMLFCYKILIKRNRMATLKGHLWNIINLGYIKEKRKEVAKIRKISDTELFKKFRLPLY